MIRTIYGFDDLGRKVPTGSYDDGYNPVGGRIFYIDSTSTATYKFYDSNGNEIQNVAVGDTPAYYKKLTDGNSKERYYIWGNFVCYKGPSRYLEFGYKEVPSIPNTNTNIGYGKLNSKTILQIEDTPERYNVSIWKFLNQTNQTILNNCNDWYIGSRDEMEQLRLFASLQGSSLVDQKGNTLIDCFTQCWSSSIDNSKGYFHYLSWNLNGLSAQGSGIPIRSF